MPFGCGRYVPTQDRFGKAHNRSFCHFMTVKKGLCRAKCTQSTTLARTSPKAQPWNRLGEQAWAELGPNQKNNIWERNVTDSSDFVVVGGGSGGCAVASRLSEDPG